MINKLYQAPIELNLQLFAEDDDSGDGSGVVDRTENFGEVDENPNDYSEGENEQDDADPDEDFDEESDEEEMPKEERAIYRRLRKKAEDEIKRKHDAEKQSIEAERQKLLAEKLEYENKAIEKKHVEAITQEQIWELADRRGIPEDVAKELLERDAKEQAREERAQLAQRIESVSREKERLKNKPYFKELEAEINSIIASDPTVNVEGVYRYLLGTNYEKLSQSATSTTEKRTLANIQDRSRRRVGSMTSDGDTDTTQKLSDVGKKLAIAMGVDPREVAKHVKNRRNDFR